MHGANSAQNPRNAQFEWLAGKITKRQLATRPLISNARDGGNPKPFAVCCVQLSVIGRLVTLKLGSKIGVFALALMLAALPVAACVSPGAGMTSAERECCKKMAEQCGGAGMAQSHSCCQVSSSSSDHHALKAPSSEFTDFTPVVLHGFPVSIQVGAQFTLASVAFQVSRTHGPPGLDSLTTTILRI
jgi:hypothetical protein